MHEIYGILKIFNRFISFPVIHKLTSQDRQEKCVKPIKCISEIIHFRKHFHINSALEVLRCLLLPLICTSRHADTQYNSIPGHNSMQSLKSVRKFIGSAGEMLLPCWESVASRCKLNVSVYWRAVRCQKVAIYLFT